MPTIYSSKVRLRAVERTDLPLFVAWLNDPEVAEGLLISYPMSMAEEERWFDHMLTTPAAQHPMVIEIRDEEQWVPVGNCAFHEIDWRNRFAEIGIFIGEKRFWNRGVGTTVMKMMLKHGFETINLHRIYLHVFSTNPRAIRSYEKAGFVHEGRMRESRYQNGAYADTLIMSVLRHEWKEE
ncbi:MAG TPA: GNAT family protein [Anaerolineaceae bacterium]|nr:GNAT family protein [Anaerolineaceae bacterium]HPN51405.1 GNAT family protein [Anaerolineaceae bacterium]